MAAYGNEKSDPEFYLEGSDDNYCINHNREIAKGRMLSPDDVQYARDVAVLGSDAASDVRPTGVEGMRGPVHTLVLVAMGVPILDNCDLEQVAAAAHQRKRWEFLLTTAPLAVPGATGSALNPIAIF